MHGSRSWSALCLAFAIGCGAVEHNASDDGSGDDSGPATDAAGPTRDAAGTPDARPPAPITVTVLTDNGDLDTSGMQLPLGLPRQGAEVYFIQPGGETERLVTGGTGVAISQPVGEDTAVLVVRPQSPTQFSVIGYLALSPDTRVVAGPRPETLAETNAGGTMTIIAPAVTGASSYNLSMPCLNSLSLVDTTFTATLGVPCDATGRTILVTAVDDAGAAIEFTRTTVDLLPGTSITMPPSQAPATFVASLSNLPANVATADVGVQMFDGEQLLGAWSASGAPSGGSLVAQAPSTPAGNLTAIRALFWDASGQSQKQWNQYSRYTGDAVTNIALDAAQMMPFTSQPQWDPATRTVSWEESGTTNRADIGIAHGGYYKEDAGISVTVRIVFPHVATSVSLPAFPPQLATIAPTADDGGYFNEVYLVDDVDREGYLATVETADADSRNALFGRYGAVAEAWISGGGSK
jgi:hypothetical protein